MLCNAVRPAAGMIRRGLVPGDIYYVPNDDAAEAFADASSWSWDATRGYYRNITSETPIVVIIPHIDRVRKIIGTFWSYYNTPSSCIGYSYLIITLDDATSILLGARDGWTDPSNGQNIFKGDAGNENRVTRNVVGETYTYTIPTGRTVVDISVLSAIYSPYPYATRGMRDIFVTY